MRGYFLAMATDEVFLVLTARLMISFFCRKTPCKMLSGVARMGERKVVDIVWTEKPKKTTW
jgi:hypothetical protein